MQLPTKLEVRIKSEAIFSSGEGENLIHTRTLTDRYGFVYFHAKTLKGQLKRQAFWLFRHYQGCDPARAYQFFGSIVELFGVNKDEIDRYYPGEKKLPFSPSVGCLNLGNLELDEKIREYLRSLLQTDTQDPEDVITPHDLIEAQTNIRTSIQIEEGVAKDRMMTNYQTVKTGLIFYSKLNFDPAPSSRSLEDFHRIVCSFRRIGAGIHRGRGLVRARLLVEKQDGEALAFVPGY